MLRYGFRLSCDVQIAILLVAGFGTVQLVPPVDSRHPFTARVKHTYTDELGSKTEFEEVFARKTDGSTARTVETEAQGGERGTRKYIADTVTRSFTDTCSFTRTSTAAVLLEEWAFKPLVEYPGSCARFKNWQRKGASLRLKIKVYEYENVISEAENQKVWIAPELECYPLLELLIENGEVRNKSEVLSLEIGEPDPALFRIPSGYTEVSPLQYEELYRKRFPGDKYYDDVQAAKLERQYQEGRAKAAERK